jgi:hypothetical protein
VEDVCGFFKGAETLSLGGFCSYVCFNFSQPSVHYSCQLAFEIVLECYFFSFTVDIYFLNHPFLLCAFQSILDVGDAEWIDVMLATDKPFFCRRTNDDPPVSNEKCCPTAIRIHLCPTTLHPSAIKEGTN